MLWLTDRQWTYADWGCLYRWAIYYIYIIIYICMWAACVYRELENCHCYVCTSTYTHLLPDRKNWFSTCYSPHFREDRLLTFHSSNSRRQTYMQRNHLLWTDRSFPIFMVVLCRRDGCILQGPTEDALAAAFVEAALEGIWGPKKEGWLLGNTITIMFFWYQLH